MPTLHNIASALAKTCPPELLAGILNCLLSCDAEPSLTDGESEAGLSLFDALCEIVPPEIVELAQHS